MEITGKIISVLEPVSGTSKAGREWKKQEYVLEVPNGDFEPRKVFFNFFGTAADQYQLKAGKDYKISFNLESREFNGRWYTDVRAWKAEEVGNDKPSQNGTSQASHPEPPKYPVDDPFGAPANNDFAAENPDSLTDDLPF